MVEDGRFCQEWSELQDSCFYRERATLSMMKKLGLTWQTGLINKIWNKWYELWKRQIKDVHGRDQASQAIAVKREVKGQLIEIMPWRTKMILALEDFMRRYPHTPGATYVGYPKLVNSVWWIQFYSKRLEGDKASNPRAPIKPKLFQQSIGLLL